MRQIAGQDHTDPQKRPKISLNLRNDDPEGSQSVYPPVYAKTASPFIYNPIGSQKVNEKSATPFNIQSGVNQLRSPEGKVKSINNVTKPKKTFKNCLMFFGFRQFLQKL